MNKNLKKKKIMMKFFKNLINKFIIKIMIVDNRMNRLLILKNFIHLIVNLINDIFNNYMEKIEANFKNDIDFIYKVK